MKKLLALILSVALVFGLAGCLDDFIEEKEADPHKDEVIYEDKNVKVTFKGISSAEGQEVIYLNLEAENKTNKTFTVLLGDVAINKYEIKLVVPAVEMTIKAGNKMATSFGAFTTGTGIAETKDVENIVFKIMLDDENRHTFLTTKQIRIDYENGNG